MVCTTTPADLYCGWLVVLFALLVALISSDTRMATPRMPSWPLAPLHAILAARTLRVILSGAKDPPLGHGTGCSSVVRHQVPAPAVGPAGQRPGDEATGVDGNYS